MNPNPAFWWDLFGRLMLESSALMVLAMLVSRKLQPQQQRTVWQMTLAALLLLLAVEGTGVHQHEYLPASEAQSPSTSRRLTIEVLPGPSHIPVATPTEPHVQPRPSASGWLPGIFWLAVAGAILVRSFGRRLLFVILKHRRRPLNVPVLQEKVAALSRSMHLGGRIHLSECDLLKGPIAFGFLRRCICVPDGFRRDHTSREQEVMLAHEVAHLAVRDPLWYAAVDFAAALFWFNPMVWFGRARFQAACETAADEASLLVPEGGPRTLAECLVQLGKRLVHVNSYGWIGIEGKRFRSALGRRVNRLLTLDGNRWHPASRRWKLAACGVGALTCAGLLASSAAFARSGTQSLAARLWHLRWLAAEPLRVQTTQPTPAVSASRSLHTRFFRVDAAQFERSVREFIDKRQVRADDSFVEDLKFLIESLGVDLSPPAQIFYNSRLGSLMVRAEIHELDAIEQFVQVINTPPPQLTIEAKFVEFNDPRDASDIRNLAIGAHESATNSFRGILTPSRYRELMERLETRTGVDILATPKVTTLSRRPAQIKVVDVRYVVTGIDESGAGPGLLNRPKPIAEPFEVGPVLDVIPLLESDGVSIELTLIPTIREFIGYDLNPLPYFDGGLSRPLTPAPLREYAGEKDVATSNPFGGAPIVPNPPLPIFRMRQAQATARVWDGQTVVLSLPIHLPTSTKRNLRFEPSGKTCFLFVTPTLIDPAGNALHNDSTLPAREQTVPD